MLLERSGILGSAHAKPTVSGMRRIKSTSSNFWKRKPCFGLSVTIDCLSKTITFPSDYISLSPQRFGFKMSFSILKSRSTAALEAASWRKILKEGRAH